MTSNLIDRWNRLWGNVWKNYILGVKGIEIIICVLKFFCLLEMVAFLVDLCPADYWFDWIERIFEYDTSTVIPVVAIAWGVVSIPIGFLLGQIEHRNYGIRLIDFLVAGLGKGNSVFLIGSFWVQLVFIVLSSAYNRSVMFTVVTWTQLIYVFCFSYLVMLSISHEAMVNIVCKQSREICGKLREKNSLLENEIKDKSLKQQNAVLSHCLDPAEMRHWLLVDIIKNVDYCRDEDVENLKKILKDSVCSDLNGLLGRKIVYDLFKIMLSGVEKEVKKQIVSDIFNADVSVDTCKGILAALISERNPDFYQLCNCLIGNFMDKPIDKKKKEHLLIWTILWGMHQENFVIDLMEKVYNDTFIESIQKISKEYGVCFANCDKMLFNDIVLESCKDVMALMNVDAVDKIIVSLFEYRLTF